MTHIVVTWNEAPRIDLSKQGQFSCGDNTYFIEIFNDGLVTVSNDKDFVKPVFLGKEHGKYYFVQGEKIENRVVEAYVTKQEDLQAVHLCNLLHCDPADANSLIAALKQN